MEPRLDYMQVLPEGMRTINAVQHYVDHCGLEPALLELVKVRASQINGCAYCVDMHSKEARHTGLSEQWIILMSAWKESPIYDAKERALLGWVDAVTRIADTGIPDAAFDALKAHFTEEEIVKITVALGVINTWNRLAVGFRNQHPIDKPASKAA